MPRDVHYPVDSHDVLALFLGVYELLPELSHLVIHVCPMGEPERRV
jgi:hypothetical protein